MYSHERFVTNVNLDISCHSALTPDSTLKQLEQRCFQRAALHTMPGSAADYCKTAEHRQLAVNWDHLKTLGTSTLTSVKHVWTTAALDPATAQGVAVQLQGHGGGG